MLTKLEQWWERKIRWFSNLPTWGKVLTFILFAVLAAVVSTLIVILSAASPAKIRRNTYANTTPDPMIPLLEGQEAVNVKVKKAMTQAQKEIGDVTIKQERLDAAAKEAHQAIEEAKSPGEIVKIIRRGVYAVIFFLLIPLPAWADVGPIDTFYPMPPGREVEINGVLHQCFTYDEMQTLGHGYVEYEKLFRLRSDLLNLITTAQNAIIIGGIGAETQQTTIRTLTAQNGFYKESIDRILRQHEEAIKKKEIELWAWRIAAGLLAVTATVVSVF